MLPRAGVLEALRLANAAGAMRSRMRVTASNGSRAVGKMDFASPPSRTSFYFRCEKLTSPSICKLQSRKCEWKKDELKCALNSTLTNQYCFSEYKSGAHT